MKINLYVTLDDENKLIFSNKPQIDEADEDFEKINRIRKQLQSQSIKLSLNFNEVCVISSIDVSMADNYDDTRNVQDVNYKLLMNLIANRQNTKTLVQDVKIPVMTTLNLGRKSNRVKPLTITICNTADNVDDSNITLNPYQHTYIYTNAEGKKINAKLSGSTLIKYIEKDYFNGEFISERMAISIKRGTFTNTKYNYLLSLPNLQNSYTENDIALALQQVWKMKGRLSCEYGTFMHESIELFYKDDKFRYNPSLHFEHVAFYKFVAEYQLQPYTVELKIFCEIAKLGGTIDALFLSPTDDYKGNDLIIVDWKRCTLNDNATAKKINGVSVPQSIYKYSIQVNIYRKILEEYYGKRVVGMFLWIVDSESKNDLYTLHSISREGYEKIVNESFNALIRGDYDKPLPREVYNPATNINNLFEIY